MRQIIAFLLDFKVARLSCKPQIFGIFLSLSCPIALADSTTSAVIDASNELQAEQDAIDVRNNIPTHTVILGDTLWSVAKRLRPDNMPMAEAMDTLYLYNREAFLKGDSTKLIEGSVVSFPPIPAVKEVPQLIVSEDNSALIIPTIEVITETNFEAELSAEKNIEMEPQPAKENLESEKQESFSDLDSAIDNKVEDKPIQTEPKTLFFEQFDAQDFSQLLSKVKQLPIDLWVFVVALLFAVVINRSRKLSRINKAQQDSADKTEKAIDSVLDGPFAESIDDDVFSDGSEKAAANKSQSKAVELESDEVINLPGVEALEAQLREDADKEQSQASTFLNVDFEDDTLDIDPLQIKLDMASLCIEMGDIESAQAILEEVIGEADKQGKAKAKKILDSIET
ncbi:MAG: FimV/HubP family polar landmark protein [Porticoccaceae bacterium]